jgi:DNA-binding MarR family transcriptional regulator
MSLNKNAGRTVVRPATNGAQRPAKLTQDDSAAPVPVPDQWRHDNIGRLLNNAVRRFEGRILELMDNAGYEAARISHVNLTRNLDRGGTRLTELAIRSGMTKQAMGELVDQCESIGLVERESDPVDKRAKIVKFTRRGVEWLDAFRQAVDQAENEMRAELGGKPHDALRSGLKTYGSDHDTLAK